MGNNNYCCYFQIACAAASSCCGRHAATLLAFSFCWMMYPCYLPRRASSRKYNSFDEYLPPWRTNLHYSLESLNKVKYWKIETPEVSCSNIQRSGYGNSLFHSNTERSDQSTSTHLHVFQPKTGVHYILNIPVILYACQIRSIITLN